MIPNNLLGPRSSKLSLSLHQPIPTGSRPSQTIPIKSESSQTIPTKSKSHTMTSQTIFIGSKKSQPILFLFDPIYSKPSLLVWPSPPKLFHFGPNNPKLSPMGPRYSKPSLLGQSYPNLSLQTLGHPKLSLLVPCCSKHQVCVTFQHITCTVQCW